MSFADGEQEDADCVIACDRVHSKVRSSNFVEGNVAARPQFLGTGAYRAVLSADRVEEKIGTEIATTFNVFLGPSGHVVMYPIDKGRKVNFGLWTRKSGPWLR